MARDFAIRALAITLSINFLLFFLQLAVLEVNPAHSDVILNIEDSPLGAYDPYGNYTLDEDPSLDLPEDAESVNDGGNIFTDSWKTVKNWISRKTGFSYLRGIVTAFPTFLKVLNIPAALAWALGAFWYGFMILAIVMFIRGD